VAKPMAKPLNGKPMGQSATAQTKPPIKGKPPSDSAKAQDWYEATDRLAQQFANDIREQMKTERLVLVLGGGAPHSPLMAGALYALNDRIRRRFNGGKGRFDAIYTAGGGALIGLLYVAPQGGDARHALRSIVNMGVADSLYRTVPLAYKTFRKPGPFEPVFQEWAETFKLATKDLPEFRNWVTRWLEMWGGPARPHQPRYGGFVLDDPQRRLYEDWVDFVFGALAPSTLTSQSIALCEPVPYLEKMVNFDALKRFRGEFYVNAYDVTLGRPQQFKKRQINANHIKAALAFPFIYPPGKIGHSWFTEGALHDPLLLPRGADPSDCPDGCGPEDFDWFAALQLAYKKYLQPPANGGPTPTIVYMDILGSLAKPLLRRPRDLWDAYGQSIITPIVGLAQKDLEQFMTVQAQNVYLGAYRLLDITFAIPPDCQPHILAWNHSNLCELWDVGYEAGVQFWREHAAELG